MNNPDARRPVPLRRDPPVEDDGVKWLALAIRQGLLLIVAAIERRYGLKREAS